MLKKSPPKNLRKSYISSPPNVKLSLLPAGEVENAPLILILSPFSKVHFYLPILLFFSFYGPPYDAYVKAKQ